MEDLQLAISVMNVRNGHINRTEVLIPKDKIEELNFQKKEQFIKTEVTRAVEKILVKDNLAQLIEVKKNE